MLIIFLITSLINGFSWEALQTAEHVQNRLRKLTDYSSLYELFNLSELKTNKDIIKKRWRDLLVRKELYDGKKVTPEIVALLTSAYDLMTKHKDVYDFLMDNPFYLTRLLKCNGWYNLIFILMGVFLVVVIDFAIVAKRIITFKRVKKSKVVRPKLKDMKTAKIFEFFLKSRPKKKRN